LITVMRALNRAPPNRTKYSRIHSESGTKSSRSTHCGSGCTLGDIVAELFAIAAPLTSFGMRGIPLLNATTVETRGGRPDVAVHANPWQFVAFEGDVTSM
jgi:hypothetical protein